MKKCLLIGYYGYENLGDDLLFIEALSKIPSYYDIYINAHENLALPTTGDRDIIKIGRKDRRTYYDLIILNGGGLFPSTKFGIRQFVTYLRYFFQSKKIVINGIGIVPKQGFVSNFLFGSFLRMASYISVRDDVSKQYVDKLLFNKKCINCHDLFFGRELLPLPKTMNDKRKGLLVCIANPFSEEEKKDPNIVSRYNKLVKQLQDAIYRISSNYTDNKVSFLPFFKGSDEILINDILKDQRLRDSQILSTSSDFKIEKVDEVFSRYKFGICMRFHSIVLSIRNCLPFVGICYDYKSESLIKEAGLGKVWVKYGIRKKQFYGIENDIDEVEFHKAIDEVVCNYSLIETTMNNIRNKYHEAVLKNYEAIYKII